MELTYRFKILSPQRRVLDEDVVSIVAPGDVGYFGVLANHAPFISTMKPGEVTVRFPDGTDRRYRIDGGIFRVAHNSAVLLAETVEEITTSA
jgi:F-type H+-transporting ATPase subunit epsilon